jgi:hypothetical protein
VDEFLRVLPFQEASGYGPSVQINQVTDLGGVAFYLAGGGLVATQGATTLSTFTFARVGGTAQVDDADIAASADPNDQLELQVAMRKVALLRTLSPNMIFGDGVAPNMLGLFTQIEAVGGQTIDLAGAAPVLRDYHRLVALVKASDGALGTGADALVMNLYARRQLTSLIETAGGCPSYEIDAALGVPVLKFDGLPVYVTDGIPIPPGPDFKTTILAVKLKGPTGIRMLHVGGSSQEFGIVVDEVPNQLAVNQRAKIVRGYYALLVPEAASAAAMKNASVTGFVP